MSEPSDILPDVERVVDGNETRVFVADRVFHPPFRNPIKVVDSTGRILGAATLSWDPIGIRMQFFLDPHTPEAFDLEVDPNRPNIKPNLVVSDDGIDGTIVIE